MIKVTYVKDDAAVKTLSYTVEHWIEGEKTARDSETVSQKVWVNAADTLNIADITLKTYTGYKYGNNDKSLELNAEKTGSR